MIYIIFYLISEIYPYLYIYPYPKNYNEYEYDKNIICLYPIHLQPYFLWAPCIFIFIRRKLVTISKSMAIFLYYSLGVKLVGVHD
jgi:hypothetical protein